MSYLTAITIFHSVLSLFAIVTGVPVVIGLFGNGSPRGSAEAFIGLAIATSATGFLFPFTGFTPPVVTAIVALLVLGLVLLARYRFPTIPAWRRIHDAAVAISLYLLLFVGVVQAFLKLPALHRLAPTQSEPPFAMTQLALLALFLVLTLAVALRTARPAAE